MRRPTFTIQNYRIKTFRQGLTTNTYYCCCTHSPMIGALHYQHATRIRVQKPKHILGHCVHTGQRWRMHCASINRATLNGSHGRWQASYISRAQIVNAYLGRRVSALQVHLDVLDIVDFVSRFEALGWTGHHQDS